MQRLSLDNSLSPSRSCDAWYGVWRRSTLRLYVSWNFVFGAIIIGFYHWGGLCVVCSSCHRSAVQVGEDMLTGGYVLNGLHPRLLSIRTYGALPGCFAGRTWGIAALESSVGAKEHSRGCNPRNGWNPRNGCKSPVNCPRPIEPRSGGQ